MYAWCMYVNLSVGKQRTPYSRGRQIDLPATTENKNHVSFSMVLEIHSLTQKFDTPCTA